MQLVVSACVLYHRLFAGKTVESLTAAVAETDMVAAVTASVQLQSAT